MFLGSGKKFAEAIHNEQPKLTALQILRRVITESQCDSVGGGMQFGDFRNGLDLDFRICGVQDYKVGKDGSLEGYFNTLRGIDLYTDTFERDNDGFHIAYTFGTPFDEDVEAIWRKSLNG